MGTSSLQRSRRRRRVPARRVGAAFALGALTAGYGLLSVPAANADPAPDAPVTEVVTPGPFSETVPAGVCAVRISIAGGSGGDALGGATQGAGAVINLGAISVSPGQTVTGAVGGRGGNTGVAGINGGGEGSPTGGHRGAGGGGYTEVSIEGGDRLALAAGGGGSGGGHVPAWGHGGDAGVPTGTGIFPGQDGLDGDDGAALPRPGGGKGGLADAGGAGGVQQTDPALSGQAGSALQGGAGGDEPSLDGGAGGGGGLFGGGGGASTTLDAVGGAGGGGGSSYVADAAPFDSGALNENGEGYANLAWVMCDYDLSVTKVAQAQAFEPGVPVSYTVTVTNNGPEGMAVGDTVTLTDPLAAGGTLTGVSNDGDGAAFECAPEIGGTIDGGVLDCSRPVDGGSRGLDVGEVLTLTYTQLVEGDEPVENTVTVTDRGDQENNAASVTVDPAAPSLDLVKSADPATITDAGQEVTYSFSVTNTGNITLSDIAISEGDFSGTGDLGPISCPEGDLEPGADTVCTAPYVATQADVDAGRITNTATASGTTPGGTPANSNSSAAEVTAEQSPALGLVKSADPETITAAGQEVTYSFAVTNTGNITLADIAINEGEFSGTGELGAISCPVLDAGLAPAAQTVCTAPYVATQADVDAGRITNTATASGSTPGGEGVTSEEAAAELPAEQNPALSLVKSADPETITAAGQTVQYTFHVTNTGNVTVTDLSVSEGEFSGTGELSAVACPAEPLAPGQSADCTATYAVTAADLGTSELTNTATAAARAPNGDPVPSNESAVKLAVQAPPPAPIQIDTGLAGDGTGPNGAMIGSGVALLGLLALAGGSWLLVQRRRRTTVEILSD